jgi:hypothetical protein
MNHSLLFKVWLEAVAVAGVISCGGDVRAQSAVPESQMDSFLGIQQGTLTGLGNGPVMNGSAIMQSITVTAGATLSFDYNFLTNVAPPASAGLLNALDPFSFAVVGPGLTDIADNYTTYPAVMSSAPVQTGFLYELGYKTFSETFVTGGTYELAVGVVDVTTDASSSGLLLDNFSLTGGTLSNGSFSTGDFTGWSTIGNTSVVSSSFGISPTDGTYQALLSTASVPEPSSLVLMLMGGVGVTIGVRRCRRRLAPALVRS